MKVGDLVLTDQVGTFRRIKPLIGIIVQEQEGDYGSYFQSNPVLVHWFESGEQCWMNRQALKIISEA
jgi:hypothetical protein